MKTKREIVEEIRNDIDKGIYQQFPKMKDKLTYIGNKLFDGIYVINSSHKLSIQEVKYLSEAGYLKSNEIDEFYNNQ